MLQELHSPQLCGMSCKTSSRRVDHASANPHNAQDEDRNYKLPLDEVNTIKQELIGLMIACPPTIQTQLGDAISIIADSDFWDRWDTLVQVDIHPSLLSRVSHHLLTQSVLVGSRLSFLRRQLQSQQRCIGGCAFHIHKMAAAIPLRCSVRRDQPCAHNLCRALPQPSQCKYTESFRRCQVRLCS